MADQTCLPVNAVPRRGLPTTKIVSRQKGIACDTVGTELDCGRLDWSTGCVPGLDKCGRPIFASRGTAYDTSGQMQSLVYNMLFTDARLSDECAAVPDGLEDRRGWWANSFRTDGNVIGSLLWTLGWERSLNETLLKAKEFAETALQPLVASGIAKSVIATAEYLSRSTIKLTVTIIGNKSKYVSAFGGQKNPSGYGYLWAEIAVQ